MISSCSGWSTQKSSTGTCLGPVLFYIVGKEVSNDAIQNRKYEGQL